MQVFAIFNVSRPVELAGAIERSFTSDHLALGGGTWLVAGEGITSREVADRLGVSEGEVGNAIIVAVDSYWGRAPGNVWEWIGARRARPLA